MFIKYSPCRASIDSVIRVTDDNTITIDGAEYTFSPNGVEWPDIATQTAGAITHAERVDGVLRLVVRRFYDSPGRPAWDTGEYQEVLSC